MRGLILVLMLNVFYLTVILYERTIRANIKFQVGLIYIHTAHRYTSLQINIGSYAPAPFLDSRSNFQRNGRGEEEGNQQEKPKRGERKFFLFHLSHYQLSLELAVLLQSSLGHPFFKVVVPGIYIYIYIYIYIDFLVFFLEFRLSPIMDTQTSAKNNIINNYFFYQMNSSCKETQVLQVLL